MKKSFQLKPLLLSLAVAGSATIAVAPSAAQAEVSYNAAVSNMYLWRGQDISNGQAVVTGGIDYSHDSGLYGGVWGSSEDAGTEFDLYLGYGMTSGDFGLNLAYWSYWYPSDGTKASFERSESSVITEYEVTLSYADFSATAMIDTEDTDLRYYSLSYGIGAFGFHAGYYDGFAATGLPAGDEDYTDFSISFAATDNLTFTVSKAQGDGLYDTNEKPMLNVSYAFTF
ncbi:TorF family putative porin [Thiomicrorhabdus heinhorstiae]|uniref:Histidine kinase n=1 Tax=Thiomicrorhabdus heinhorstiae TaxID=2748010 RepID=A0ABS0BYL7_9GAMM|nr:TorF family putative porin [Thiomicrorhabdus heinhorstiae]MBF6058888.1 hypothetical protein [Thiomicrorhabdus heinhorstiae]